MKLSTYAKRHEITYRAAWQRFKDGRIAGAYKDDFGHVWVPDPKDTRRQKAAIYARVSSRPQRDDLDRQVDRMVAYATSRGYEVVKIVKEVASGVNDTRPKLTKLLQDDSWGTLIVEHRDRLTRVGFNWFDVLLAEQCRGVDVAVSAQEETSDLMSDFLSIIYSFAARLYGLRSARNRTDRLVAALEGETNR